jgi:Membrane protein involved in the export of O-antigen and teichoic acid
MKGAFDLLLAVGAFAALAFGLGIPIGVTLAVAKRPELTRRVPLPAAVFAIAIGTLTSVVLGGWQLFTNGPGPTSEGVNLPEILAVGSLAAVTVYTAISESALVGSQRIGVANLTDLVGRLSGLAIVLALSFTATPATFVFAISLGLLFGGVLQSAVLKPQGWIERKAVATTIRQALPAYLSSGMQLANYRLDLFIVAFFSGPAEVGLYALAGLLAQFVWILARGGATALYPLFAVDDGGIVGVRRLAEASRVAVLVGIGGSVALAILVPVLVPVVYGSAFSDAVVPLWLLLPGAAIFSPAIVGAAYFLGRGAPEKNILASGTGLAMTVALDLALVPRYGMLGAAAASTLSYAATSGVTMLLLRRDTRLPFADLLIPRKDDLAHMWAATSALLTYARRTITSRNLEIRD